MVDKELTRKINMILSQIVRFCFIDYFIKAFRYTLGKTKYATIVKVPVDYGTATKDIQDAIFDGPKVFDKTLDLTDTPS
jgi:hypothetical protein